MFRLLRCFLADPKGVFPLYQTMLVRYLVSLFLFSNIFNYGSFVDPNCAHKISLAPEVAVTIAIFQVWETLEYHQCTFTFQIPHYLSHTEFWRYLKAHVYVINTCVRFNYFDPLILTELTKNCPDFLLIFAIIAVRLSPNKNVQIHQGLCYEDRA